MPAARYWRAVGLQSVGGGALELSALHLYLGGVRVDGPATLTSTFAPDSGVLAALQDDDTATTARWLDVSAPGFALVWDFGAGNAQDVAAVRLGAGVLYAEWLETLALQYSSDGVVWATLGSIAAFSWPGAKALQAVSADGDANFSAVSLLLHMDGTDGSTTFTDRSPSPKVVTAYGNAKLSAAESKFGGTSAYFDGVGDYLAAQTDISNTQSWTGECWFKVPNLLSGAEFHTFFGRYPMTSVPGRWFFGVSSTGYLRLWCAPTAFFATTAIANDGAWHHAALVVDRGLSEVRIYLDGVRVGTSPILTFYLYGEILVGTYNPGVDNEALKGYLQDVRFTVGVARYASNFTPPVAPFREAFGAASVPPPLRPSSGVPPILLSGGSAGDTVMTLPPDTTHLDRQDANGTEANAPATRYRIPGPRWVKEKTASTNVPLRRRVQLYNQRDSRLVREVWSDPVTGEYSFDNIRGDTTYFVIAFDHTGHYRAVIADNLTPEPIP